MKELKIKLDVLARTYGIDLLTEAAVEYGEDGRPILVISGEQK